MIERQVRPVSGEIMTEARSSASRSPAAGDIVDAEYVTVDPVPPAAQRRGGRERVQSFQAPPIGGQTPGMDSLRKGHQPVPHERGRRAGPIFWTGGAVLAAAAFWISGGHSLSGILFAPAGGASEGPFRIAEVRSRIDDHGERPMLLIDGEVAYSGDGNGVAPSLGIAVSGDDGRTTRYILDSRGATVAPGESFRFSSRVDAPEGGVAGVLVTMKEGPQ